MVSISMRASSAFVNPLPRDQDHTIHPHLSGSLAAPVGALGGWIVWSWFRGRGLTDSLDARILIDSIPTVL